MRAALIAVALLSGCALAPPVAERAAPATPSFTLDAGGIQPAGTDLRIDFGRAQTGVIDTVRRLHSAALVDVTVQPDCGAGAVTAARWDDGLTLNFLDGDFRGWMITDPESPLATDAGLRPGMARPSMAAAHVTETSLGTEVQVGSVFGLLDSEGRTVDRLWSGLTCFFR